jgi:hypothetical protein
LENILLLKTDSDECEQADVKKTDAHVQADMNKADACAQTNMKQEGQEKERLAYQRLAEGIPTEEDDYLDLTLEREEAFLREYQILLTNP